MSPTVADKVALLKTDYRKHQATQKAIRALVKANVVTPWPEALKHQLGLEVEGLHMIDEQALSQLNDTSFLALRKAQALAIGYALNLSIAQCHLLSRLARLNPGDVVTPENLDSFFDGDDDLSFNFDD